MPSDLGTEDSSRLRSRGYVPMDLETVDSPISNAALGLLTRMRAAADRAEQDGELSERDLRVLRAKHDLRKPAVEKALTELISVGLLIKNESNLIDSGFGKWCRTRDERDKKRAEWRARQDRKRRSSRGDTQRESHKESHKESPTSSVSAASANADAAARTFGRGSANGTVPRGIGEPAEIDPAIIEAEEQRRRLTVVRSDHP